MEAGFSAKDVGRRSQKDSWVSAYEGCDFLMLEGCCSVLLWQSLLCFLAAGLTHLDRAGETSSLWVLMAPEDLWENIHHLWPEVVLLCLGDMCPLPAQCSTVTCPGCTGLTLSLKQRTDPDSCRLDAIDQTTTDGEFIQPHYKTRS